MNKWILRIIVCAASLWLTWALHPLIFGLTAWDWDVEKLGQWGDSFGALNALFASLAFAAGLVTLRIQQRQIAVARFDSTFFELLKLLLEARDRVSFSHTSAFISNNTEFDYAAFLNRMMAGPAEEKPPVTYLGVDAFHRCWNEMIFQIQKDEESTRTIAKIYEDFVHSRIENTLGPYFRLLYTILKRIEVDANLSRDERRLYGNLVRSQLSNSELIIAGLNGMSEISKDFKLLLIKFRILKYSSGPGRKIMLEYYPDYAFKGRDYKPEKTI